LRNTLSLISFFINVKKRKSYTLEDKKKVIEWIISEGEGKLTLASKKVHDPTWHCSLLVQFKRRSIEER